ncbi:MAG: hypothetical protein LLF75_00660 [Eubacteriales bacterium]|nr:hypothetical protein [Eubacteriales bacterium]
MKLIKRVIVLLFSMILAVTSFSCAQNKTVALAATPEPTFTTAPTTAPTATPSPSPTATPFFSVERTDELNQQFQDFLNKEGEFTAKKISSMMFRIANEKDKKTMTLGLISNALKFEGYFFDYFEKDDNLILLIGFDGKDGSRFVTPLQIPLYFYEGEPKARFAFIKHYVETAYDEGVATITSENIRDVYTQLNNLKGKCIAFDPTIKTFPVSDEYPDVDKTYLKEYNSKVGLQQKLILSLNINGLNPNYDFESVPDNRDILAVENINDINNIDISNVPLIKNIYFE